MPLSFKANYFYRSLSQSQASEPRGGGEALVLPPPFQFASDATTGVSTTDPEIRPARMDFFVLSVGNKVVILTVVAVNECKVYFMVPGHTNILFDGSMKNLF